MTPSARFGITIHHPFITGIGDGSLPVEKFRFYMIQDYLYLYEYARVFALGTVKAKEYDVMRAFAGMAEATLNGEMKIHERYMKRLGITKEELNNTQLTQINASYTSYMLAIAYSGDILDILTAVLSCAWSYRLIGQKLGTNPQSLNHPFYGQWITGYSSDEYNALTQEIIDLVDLYGQDIHPARIEALKTIFIRCSRYEALFWDMAFAAKDI